MADAESYKNQGNNAYKQQNYAEAIALYSKAVGMFSTNRFCEIIII